MSRVARVGLIALVVCCGMSQACGPQTTIAQVERAVLSFESKVAKQDYEALYESADPVLRRHSTKPDFIETMRDLRTSLGDLVERRQASALELKRVDGTEVRVVYISTFANGVVEEHFTWLLHDGHLALAGYAVAPTIAQE